MRHSEVWDILNFCYSTIKRTESGEGFGGSTLGDTLNKALLISWIANTLY